MGFTVGGAPTMPFVLGTSTADSPRHPVRDFSKALAPGGLKQGKSLPIFTLIRSPKARTSKRPDKEGGTWAGPKN